MPQTHTIEPILVGRQAELRRFGEIIADPKGQAVLVVGQVGMGKTLLVNRMARMARDHPDLKCGTVRYEVTRTDDVAGTMALMIDHAFEAARAGEKFLSGTDRQWSALFKAIGVVPLVGKPAEAMGELALSLKRDPTKDTRTQFIERLRYISEKMPHDGRAVFIIDPEKYMKDDSHDAWRLVVKDLPDKIKFLFAQRPDDVLVTSPDFTAVPNVVRIPDNARSPDTTLNVLNEEEVDDLIRASAVTMTRSAAKGEGEVDTEPTPSRAQKPSRARKEADETSQAQVLPEADETPEAAATPETEATPEAKTAPHDRSLTVAARIETTASEEARSSPGNAIRVALSRYDGHPYATAAALNLLADGAPIADLPADPTPTGVADAQWRRLCDEHKENAIRLLEAYAILEVPVPDEVVDAVSGVDAPARKALTANAYVSGLLRTEPDGTRIYHSLLADHIHGQIAETEAKTYHTRAIELYRHRLTADTKPDALAAVRLPEHVLSVEGSKAYVVCFINECFKVLRNCCLLLQRRLVMVYPVDTRASLRS